jgi:hypothetical protein
MMQGDVFLKQLMRGVPPPERPALAGSLKARGA